MVVVLATGGRGQRIAGTIVSGADAQMGEAGFKLTTVHVEGASAMATPDIVKAAQVFRNQPILGLNLQDVRAKVEKVGWVEDAKVVRLLPDTLVLAVTERKQLAVWQRWGRTMVIDEKGRVIPEADAARFPQLPLVVGEGGAEHAPEILPIVAQRPDLMSRMEAFVRVDDRRWDLRLKDGALIQLPAVGEEDALMRLEALDRRTHLMATGFDRVDLRNPDVVAIRPKGAELPPPPKVAGA
jgi:cell division protein FtsQ